MAERARKGFYKADGLRAISLDDVPEGGLDVLWDQLKSLAADRSEDPASGGAVKRADAEATLQQAEEEAMQAAQEVFEKMRAEVEQELAGAQNVKTAALEAQQEAESALKQANQIREIAHQKADELVAEAENAARAAAADSDKKAKKRIADAEAGAQKILAEAETGAEQILRDANSAAESARESLLAETIQEIKPVKDAVERLRDELDEELETQRILTRATRLNAVSRLVAGDASGVAGNTGKQSDSQRGQAAEDPG